MANMNTDGSSQRRRPYAMGDKVNVSPGDLVFRRLYRHGHLQNKRLLDIAKFVFEQDTLDLRQVRYCTEYVLFKTLHLAT